MGQGARVSLTRRNNPITSAGTFLNQCDIQYHRTAYDTRAVRSSRRALAAVHAIIYQGTACAGLSYLTTAVTSDMLDQAMPRLPTPRIYTYGRTSALKVRHAGEVSPQIEKDVATDRAGRPSSGHNGSRMTSE